MDGRSSGKTVEDRTIGDLGVTWWRVLATISVDDLWCPLVARWGGVVGAGAHKNTYRIRSNLQTE